MVVQLTYVCCGFCPMFKLNVTLGIQRQGNCIATLSYLLREASTTEHMSCACYRLFQLGVGLRVSCTINLNIVTLLVCLSRCLSSIYLIRNGPFTSFLEPRYLVIRTTMSFCFCEDAMKMFCSGPLFHIFAT